MSYYNFIKSCFDFFLPISCPSCKNKLLVTETYVCKNCLDSIQTIPPERIKYEYDRKFYQDKYIKDFFAYYLFQKNGTLQHIIHSFKYESKFLIAIFMGKILGKKLKDVIPIKEIDFIHPVPLHRLKKVERGFNQSFYLAKGIEKETSIRAKNNILKRKKYTLTQTKMNFIERENNMRNAFKVVTKVEGKNIILVDDIITTGATINECARVLKQKGAKDIYAVSLGLAD